MSNSVLLSRGAAPEPGGSDRPGQNVFLRQAAAIGETIRHRVIHTVRGAAVWTTEPPHADWNWEGRPGLRYDLYGGICGIALFLAALDHELGRSDHADLVYAAINPFSELSSKQIDDWLARDTIAAGTGAGSVIYALIRIADFLGDDKVRSAAFRIASRLPTEKVVSNRCFDLMGGSAGGIMVFAALYNINPESWIRERALLCGEHLLRNRTTTSSGLRAWETSPGKCQTGYAHGAAGIAHALCRLFELAGDSIFRDAAKEAIAYENSLFCEEEGNWPHLLLPNQNGGFECWNSWCNGAPGIGLGRLGCIPGLGREDLMIDIERSVRAAARSGRLSHFDIPCCGTLGRVELFLESWLRLGEDRYKQLALLLANSAVDRAIRKGRYGFGNGDSNGPVTFHKGLAGIGYQLLRISSAGELPSVLSWE